jgi:hypothetical protein
MAWRRPIIVLAFLAGLAIPVAEVLAGVPQPCCSGQHPDCITMCATPSNHGRADWCKGCCDHMMPPIPEVIMHCYTECGTDGMNGPCDCSC